MDYTATVQSFGNFFDKILIFAWVLQEEQIQSLRERDLACEANVINCNTKIALGKTWARVDVGSSGKYMVAMVDMPAKGVKQGDIVAIKAYGVPNLLAKHRHGNLDTIDKYDWREYHARAIMAA